LRSLAASPREFDIHDHAEESALRKVARNGPRLTGATMYSSMEPCSIQASRPVSCTKLILAAGLRRVVFAWQEANVRCGRGAETLRGAGIEVIEIADMATTVRQINGHLLDDRTPDS
jgi:pyrimidine deaminase RibD-like protein